MTGDPTLDLILSGLYGLFGGALLFEVAVRWLRSALHRHGAVDSDG